MQMQMSTYRFHLNIQWSVSSTPFLTRCIVSIHFPYIIGKNHTCLFWTENSYVTSRSNWACCSGLWTFACLSCSSDKAAQRSTGCPLIVYKWGLKSILYFCECYVCVCLHLVYFTCQWCWATVVSVRAGLWLFFIWMQFSFKEI